MFFYHRYLVHHKVKTANGFVEASRIVTHNSKIATPKDLQEVTEAIAESHNASPKNVMIASFTKLGTVFVLWEAITNFLWKMVEKVNTPPAGFK